MIEFVIDRHPDDLSLELFKKDYDYYGLDLLDEMEEGFLNYLRLFFDDEGMPYLGDVFALSYQEVTLYDVVLDLEFMKKFYPSQDFAVLTGQIEQWLK